MKRIIHNKKLYVTILLVILLFTIWYIGGSGKNVPQNMFKDIFGFELPESAVFEEFDAKAVYAYEAEVVINKSDLDYVYERFNDFYGNEAVREEELEGNKSKAFYDMDIFRGMKRRRDWFDLNYWDVDTCYYKMTAVKLGMGGDISTQGEEWVFIHINDDDTATLYIIIR